MTTSFTVETAHLPENDDMFDTDIETEDILKGYFSNCKPIIEAINDIEKKSLSK